MMVKDDVARIARGAASGGKSAGQIEFEIQELLKRDNVMDRWLGKVVITGDGRLWTVTHFTGPKGGGTVTLASRDEHVDAHLWLPVYLFVGAIEYGLLEEV